MIVELTLNNGATPIKYDAISTEIEAPFYCIKFRADTGKVIVHKFLFGTIYRIAEEAVEGENDHGVQENIS